MRIPWVQLTARGSGHLVVIWLEEVYPSVLGEGRGGDNKKPDTTENVEI